MMTLMAPIMRHEHGNVRLLVERSGFLLSGGRLQSPGQLRDIRPCFGLGTPHAAPQTHTVTSCNKLAFTSVKQMPCFRRLRLTTYEEVCQY